MMMYVMIYIAFTMLTGGLVYPKIVGQFQDIWEGMPDQQEARLGEHRKIAWKFAFTGGWMMWLVEKEMRNASSVY